MMMYTKTTLTSIGLTGFLAFLALIRPADAATLEAEYSLKLTSKEIKLTMPGDPDASLLAMWDSAFLRIADRNMPWIELTNSGNSTGEITQFQLTIGDESAHFSDEHFGDFIMESSTDSPGVGLMASVADGGDTLILDITGLGPGEVARFRVDLDPDDPADFPHPDFRQTFFDLNGSSTADNSRLQVKFADGSGGEMVLTNVLPDYPVNDPIFFERFLRPYSVMEPVTVFELDGRSVIPEPSTATLLGLCCLGVWRSRRSRSQAA